MEVLVPKISVQTFLSLHGIRNAALERPAHRNARKVRANLHQRARHVRTKTRQDNLRPNEARCPRYTHEAVRRVFFNLRYTGHIEDRNARAAPANALEKRRHNVFGALRVNGPNERHDHNAIADRNDRRQLLGQESRLRRKFLLLRHTLTQRRFGPPLQLFGIEWRFGHFRTCTQGLDTSTAEVLASVLFSACMRHQQDPRVSAKNS